MKYKNDGVYVKLFTKIVVHIYWSLLKNIKVKNMEILCKNLDNIVDL